MAIQSDIRVFPGTMLRSQDFAILAEKITPHTSGILYGCTPTIKSTSIIHVTAGWIIIRGRIIRVEDGDLSATLPTSGTSTMYLVVTVDLSNADAPCTIDLASSVGTDSANFNVVSGKAYLSLGKVTIASTGLSSITSIPSVIPSTAAGSATNFTISTSGWSSATTTVDGTAYYIYAISLKNCSDAHPEVMIGATGTLPTTAQQSAFDKVKYVTVNVENLQLKLYATSKPTSDFVITVKGVS